MMRPCYQFYKNTWRRDRNINKIQDAIKHPEVISNTTNRAIILFDIVNNRGQKWANKIEINTPISDNNPEIIYKEIIGRLQLFGFKSTFNIVCVVGNMTN